VWVGVLVASAPFASRQAGELTGGGFEAPGSESAAAESMVASAYPAARDSHLAALIVTRPGGSRSELHRALASLEGAARETPRVRAVSPPLAAARPLGDRLALLVPLPTAVREDRATDVAGELDSALAGDAGGDSAKVYLVGQGALIAAVQNKAKDDLARAERSGFPLILIVLLAVFGSIAAALVPFAVGIVAITLTGALIFALAQAMEMSVYVTTLASMVGIGVSVDYTLFLIARFRQETALGRPPDEARAIALATSGRSVRFSGLTVIVALAGLMVVDNTALRSMAIGAMVVVTVSVVAAATIVPAVLALAGERLARRNRLLGLDSLRARAARMLRPGGEPFWRWWSELVMRHAALTAILSGGLLLLLALPAATLTTHTGALAQLPADDPAREGSDLATRFGLGAPTTRILIRFPEGSAAAKMAAARRVGAAAAKDRQAALVGRPRLAADGQTALIEVTPAADPESQNAKAMVDRLRRRLPTVARRTAIGTEVLVGGVTAAQLDSERYIAGSLWSVIGVVLLLSLIVLIVLLQSIVLPIKSVILNLLSVGAAYGVLVIVFQWGWFDGLVDFRSPGYIDTLTLPLVLAVVFGLSMDYEVFLLSRIRERHLAGDGTSRAVAAGLSASAATISSAALIMVVVFSVFVVTSVPSIKEIGLGSAVAVALDATIVRLTLVPAAMVLLGPWNWWLPAFVKQRLKRVESSTARLRPEVGE
jgi:RND superfamily putative drug exporter